MRWLALWLIILAAPVAAQDIGAQIEVDALGNRTLTQEVMVPVSIEQVWQAISSPQGWTEWAAPAVRIIPGTDRFVTSFSSAALPGSPGGTVEQQWIAQNAPTRAAFRITHAEGFAQEDSYRKLTNVFWLEPAGDHATLVRLVGSPYAPGPAGDALLAYVTQAHRTALQQLRQRFVSGPIDWSAQISSGL